MMHKSSQYCFLAMVHPEASRFSLPKSNHLSKSPQVFTIALCPSCLAKGPWGYQVNVPPKRQRRQTNLFQTNQLPDGGVCEAQEPNLKKRQAEMWSPNTESEESETSDTSSDSDDDSVDTDHDLDVHR
ncbi:hypothetical protein AeRB84_002035 [Aphanomyces euteiches]|nr:hypothetical protein AeRB84_002035 [Aphanomyces euteiches]